MWRKRDCRVGGNKDSAGWDFLVGVSRALTKRYSIGQGRRKGHLGRVMRKGQISGLGERCPSLHGSGKKLEVGSSWMNAEKHLVSKFTEEW